MKNIGVYKIINKVNNKLYIGSSLNLKRRFNEHKNLLRKNKHGNKYLQAAWNKYGEDNFEFIILESYENLTCEALLILEQTNLDLFKSYDSNIGYNLSKTADRASGWHQTEEAKQLMSEKQKGELNHFFGKTHSKENKEIISKANKGKIISQEQKDNISKKNKGIKKKPLSTYTKLKISKANKGKKRSLEVKEKMSQTRKGRKHSQETKEEMSRTRKGRKHSQETKLKMQKPKSKETKIKISETRLNKKIKHSSETKLKISLKTSGKNNPRARKIDMYNLQESFIRTFNTIKEAQKFIIKGDIKKALKDFSRTAGGYKWKYNLIDI